jgi:hypothetical protein
MYPTTVDMPIASEENHPNVRRVSAEPTEGYVLDPWSGLYRESESTYQSRLQAAPPLSA